MIFLTQLEREWYARKTTGFTAQTPLRTLQRAYWASVTGSTDTPQLSLSELENRFLQTYIASKGKAASSPYTNTLWKEAVAAQGIVTPGITLAQNKLKFFSNEA